jgi:hypothetical protein
MKTIQPRSPVLTIQRTLENKTEKFAAYNSDENKHESWRTNTGTLRAVFTIQNRINMNPAWRKNIVHFYSHV